MEELLEAVKETHTDKDGNVVLLYTPNPEGQHGYVSAARGCRLHRAPPRGAR